MPIASTKPPKVVQQPNPIVVANPVIKTVVVDTRYQSISSLLTNIEGSSWITFYYSQAVNTDNALQGQQSSGSAVVQQYKLIKNLELKVTTPLNTSQDSDSLEMQATGTATLYPGIIPNEGDMFLADIGDGREGIFKITTTTRKSIFQEACYEVEYLLVNIADAFRKGDLNQKVVETFEFVKDFITHGQNPLVQEDEYVTISKLVTYYRQILSRYFSLFSSKEYATLLIPGQGRPIYDHFLAGAMRGFHETFQAPEIRKVRVLNCDDDDVLNSITLWTAIKNQDIKLIRHCVKQVGLVPTYLFTRVAVLEGVRYSGISEVVYPLNYEQSVNTELGIAKKLVSETPLTQVPPSSLNLSDMITQTDLESVFGPSPNVITKNVTIDNYYILSEAFYSGNKEQQSLFELMVTDYLNAVPVPLNKLLLMCRSYPNWGALEQFYYLPILLVMIKANIRNI